MTKAYQKYSIAFNTEEIKVYSAIACEDVTTEGKKHEFPNKWSQNCLERAVENFPIAFFFFFSFQFALGCLESTWEDAVFGLFSI